MTAATLTPAGDTLAHGYRVLGRAEVILAAPWVHADNAILAANALEDAIEVYEAIRDDVIHETAYYPDVAREAEPKTAALALAAEEIADWAHVLTIALPAAQDTAEGRAA